jgi:hypothetical protein
MKISQSQHELLVSMARVYSREIDDLKITCGEASHEELCDKALTHYEEISNKACCWNSTVVQALKFYKSNGGRRA